LCSTVVIQAYRGCCKLNLANLHQMTRTCGCERCSEEREEREARENEEKELQLLMEIEEERRKQREHAAEQVRQVKVSVSGDVCSFLNSY